MLWVGVVSLVTGLLAPAFAGTAFTPTIKFSPSTRKAGANPTINVRIAQAAGEESIDKVTFFLPARFRFPSDASITEGEKLGQGQFTSSIAPFCNTTLQQTFDATANERDRTAGEIQQGVKTVWVVDLGPVEVDLVFSRSASGGWRATADVPNSPVVCPPSALVATLNKTSADSATRIWQHPKKPGAYTLKSIFSGTEGSKHVVKQRIRITR
jgi:hypothetical protein